MAVRARLPAAGIAGAAAGAALGKAVDGDKLLGLFGLLMIAVGLAMLRPRKGGDNPDIQLTRANARRLLPLLAGVGFLVGAASGFFGIGGGFLIVPGLVGATAMPILNAVGSSLVSVTAFGATTATSYAVSGLVDWGIAGIFVAGGLAGGIAGTRLSHRLAARKRTLSIVFAVIVIWVGVYVALARAGSARVLTRSRYLNNAREAVKPAGTATRDGATPRAGDDLRPAFRRLHADRLYGAGHRRGDCDLCRAIPDGAMVRPPPAAAGRALSRQAQSDRRDAGDRLHRAHDGGAHPAAQRRAVGLPRGDETGGHGFHHWGIVTDRFDAEGADYAGKGYERVFTDTLPDTRVAYYDTRRDLPGMVELIEYTPAQERRHAAAHAAALTWDGSDPVRRV